MSRLYNRGVVLVVKCGAPKVDQPDFRILQYSHLGLENVLMYLSWLETFLGLDSLSSDSFLRDPVG